MSAAYWTGFWGAVGALSGIATCMLELLALAVVAACVKFAHDRRAGKKRSGAAQGRTSDFHTVDGTRTHEQPENQCAAPTDAHSGTRGGSR